MKASNPKKWPPAVSLCALIAAAGMASGPLALAQAGSADKQGAQTDPSQAKPGKAPDLAAQLSEIQRNKPPQQAFASAFTTRFFSVRTQKTRVSRGQVAYQPPGRFKWEIRDPVPEIYVSNGQVLWQHTPAQKHAKRLTPGEAGLEFLQAVTDPQALATRYMVEPWLASPAGPGSSPAAGAADSAAAFDALPTGATKNPATAAKLLAKLTPKAEGTPEEYLYLVADRASGQIEEIRIAFRNGNKNIISFEKWAKSKAGASTFDFVPPPGTAVD